MIKMAQIIFEKQLAKCITTNTKSLLNTSKAGSQPASTGPTDNQDVKACLQKIHVH